MEGVCILRSIAVGEVSVSIRIITRVVTEFKHIPVSHCLINMWKELGTLLHKEIAIHSSVENVNSRKRIVEVTASEGKAGVVNIRKVIVGVTARGIR